MFVIVVWSEKVAATPYTGAAATRLAVVAAAAAIAGAAWAWLL